VESLTRREFFTSCSRDTLKDILGAWHEFKNEQDKAARLTCEEIAIKFGRKAKNNLLKGGKKE